MTWRILDWMADENTYQQWTFLATGFHQQHNIHVARKGNLIDSYAYFHPLLIPTGGQLHLPSGGETQQVTATFNRGMYEALLAIERKEAKRGNKI